MNETRTLNVMFAKSGRGSKTTRLTLPIKWMHDMNITEDDRSIEVEYDSETKSITIKKAISETNEDTEDLIEKLANDERFISLLLDDEKQA